MNKTLRKISICGMALVMSGAFSILDTINNNNANQTANASTVKTHQRKLSRKAFFNKIAKRLNQRSARIREIYYQLRLMGFGKNHAKALVNIIHEEDPTLKANQRQVGGGDGYGYYQLNTHKYHTLYGQTRYVFTNGLTSHSARANIRRFNHTNGSVKKLMNYILFNYLRVGIMPSSSHEDALIKSTNNALAHKKFTVRMPKLAKNRAKATRYSLAERNANVNFAKNFKGSPYYLVYAWHNAPKMAKGQRFNVRGKKLSSTDTSLLWSTLKHNGFKTSKGFWTVNEVPQYLNKVTPRNAKRGTVYYNTNNAFSNTGLLLQRYHGKNTKVITNAGKNVHVTTLGKLAVPFQSSQFHFGNPIK